MQVCLCRVYACGFVCKHICVRLVCVWGLFACGLFYMCSYRSGFNCVWVCLCVGLLVSAASRFVFVWVCFVQSFCSFHILFYTIFSG